MMLDRELLEDILGRVLSRGGEYADVYVEWRRPAALVLDDGKVEKSLTGTTRGIAVRLVRGGRTSMAVSNEMEPGALREAAGALARAAERREPGAGVLRLEARRPGASHRVLEPPDSVPMGRKVDLIRGAERAAREAGEGVRQVVVTYRDSVQRVQVAGSDGSYAQEERTQVLGAVHVVAERAGIVQTGYEALGGAAGFELFLDSALEAAARTAAGRALRLLGARRAPGGRMPVVISAQAGGTMVHEAIGHGLEADLSGRGLSRFSGRLGERVASPLVSVIDDGTLPGRRGSSGFDDEGVPTQRTVLVKDGVLVGFLYDRLTAMKEGRPPTGNGRRESYPHRPIPRMTNTLIAPGASDPADVLRSTPRGLYVVKMGGGQVNTVTGEFVFDVQEGYLIEQGRAADLVRGATLTGSGPEVLMAIDMIGSDLGFSIGTCGKDGQGAPVSDALPTLRIPDMVVGGAV